MFVTLKAKLTSQRAPAKREEVDAIEKLSAPGVVLNENVEAPLVSVSVVIAVVEYC